MKMREPIPGDDGPHQGQGDLLVPVHQVHAVDGHDLGVVVPEDVEHRAGIGQVVNS